MQTRTKASRSRAWSREGLRYISVGAVAGVTDLSTYSLLTKLLGMDPRYANLISRPLGGLVSFLLNKYWTFENRGRAAVHHQAFRFACIWFACFAGSEALVTVYYTVLKLEEVLSKLAAEATLGIFSFLAQKFWTFR